jgi:glutaredoxin 3
MSSAKLSSAKSPTVEIYTTRWCPYCHMAKALLDRKGVSFSEIDVSRDREGRAAMTQRAHGRTTVPQIFIGDVHVGGCDDLHALEHAGKLDPLLTSVESSAKEASA